MELSPYVQPVGASLVPLPKKSTNSRYIYIYNPMDVLRAGEPLLLQVLKRRPRNRPPAWYVSRDERAKGCHVPYLKKDTWVSMEVIVTS